MPVEFPLEFKEYAGTLVALDLAGTFVFGCRDSAAATDHNNDSIGSSNINQTPARWQKLVLALCHVAPSPIASASSTPKNMVITSPMFDESK